MTIKLTHRQLGLLRGALRRAVLFEEKDAEYQLGDLRKLATPAMRKRSRTAKIRARYFEVAAQYAALDDWLEKAGK